MIAKMSGIALAATASLLVFGAFAADPSHAKRLPVPEAAAREKALATVRDLFKADIDKAKSPGEQIALAEKLLKTAAETKDDPVSRFVLWQLALETATKAGELQTAFAALDVMAKDFEIDELNVKSKTFATLAPKIGTKNIREAIPQAIDLVDRAVGADRFEIAKTVAEALSRLAQRLGDAAAIKEIGLQHAEAERLEKAFVNVPSALKTLESIATDPAANLTVGKYQIDKGNWGAALSYLALSEDAQYGDLAAKEMARPKDVAQRLAIADEWWKLGDAEKGAPKTRLQTHAAELYTAALPDATGLAKKKIESRLEDAAKLAKATWEFKPPAGGSQPTEKDTRTIANSIGLKLSLIPAGEFMMGSPTSEKDRFDNEIQHPVKITKPFYLGVYDVTRGQFAKFVAAAKYQTDAEAKARAPAALRPEMAQETNGPQPTWLVPGLGGTLQTDEHPVVCVSWNDALAFCDWLSKKEHKRYRLPTEAEWEYACRAGTTTAFYYGNSLSKDSANCRETPKKDSVLKCTTPVGAYKPNDFGLYDMCGNAEQWCMDWWDRSYYSNSPPSDPIGPSTGEYRVCRGGSWSELPLCCRSAFRFCSKPTDGRNITGFRVVCEATGATPTTPSKPSETKATARTPKADDDTQVHLIVVFSGRYPKAGQPSDKIRIKVTPASKPMVLVLNAYDPTVWEVTAPPGSVSEVLAVGHSAQTVEGLEKGVRVRSLSQLAGDKDSFAAFISDEDPSRLSEGTRDAIRRTDEAVAGIIKRLTGHGITSVQKQKIGVSFAVP